jgi:hypothetical protein
LTFRATARRNSARKSYAAMRQTGTEKCMQM